MARRTKSQTKTTFTPLTGGRLRCNQDGIIVKKGRTDSHRALRRDNPRGISKESLGTVRRARRLESDPRAPHMLPG